MDPIAIVFSSFLNSMSSSIHGHMTDMLGTELQAQIVEYHGHRVDYQYQLWKIKAETVCASSKQDMVDRHSQCTIAAKDMFSETCNHLEQNPQNHWKHIKLKNMYCSAAASYQPTIASISKPSDREAELWDAKQKCSLLTLEARNTGLPATEKQRQQACNEYKQLRNHP